MSGWGGLGPDIYDEKVHKNLFFDIDITFGHINQQHSAKGML